MSTVLVYLYFEIKARTTQANFAIYKRQSLAIVHNNADTKKGAEAEAHQILWVRKFVKVTGNAEYPAYMAHTGGGKYQARQHYLFVVGGGSDGGGGGGGEGGGGGQGNDATNGGSI